MANDYGNFTQDIKVSHFVEVAIVISHRPNNSTIQRFNNQRFNNTQ